MLIWWLQKITTVDFPGKIAAICFTVWCNLRCRYCYNAWFVLPTKASLCTQIPQEEVLQFLRQRRGLLDGVVICGGEPCIHADLPDFIRSIRALGYAIKLDTNGFMPEQVSSLIEDDLVDYFAIDLKYTLDELSIITQKEYSPDIYLQTLHHVKASGKPYELRTTVIKGYHTADRIRDMLTTVWPVHRYVLQNFFRTETLVDPTFDGKSFSQVEIEELWSTVSDLVGECVVRW